MSYNGSDQSDGEGFIPNKMIIKQKETNDMKDESPFLQFEPRYVTGETVIKKQPPESYQTSHSIQRYLHEGSVGGQVEIKGELPTAATAYLSQNYECVYSRFKRPFGEGEKASFSNEIIIKTLARSQHFRTLKNWRSDCIPTQQQSKKLKFDSKFQGGNLLCAFRSLLQIDTYVLFMQNDTNTNGYNQWFYFSIRETQSNRKYTFKIANFKKKYSFFKYGMQPYLFSLEESRLNKCGWYMDGQNFQYYRSNFSENPFNHYYTLEFQLTFKHAHDFVMICPTLPYSYSKLIHQLDSYKIKAEQKGLAFDFQSVSKTLGGNEVPYLRISKKVQKQGKRIIVITARQHSGQIWSSHLMDEIIQGIVGQDNSFYQWILDNFDFHIFPMINVDGVIYGNFRCDLAGYDLNRCWKQPSLLLQPHIFRIKQKIQRLADSSKIQFYFDLHTHSKEHGAFAYSCVESTQGRRLPLQISSLTPLFRYLACTFGISPDKKTTARSSVYDLTNNMNTVTIQLSAFGYKHPKTQRVQPFTLNNIKAIAQALVNGIYYYETKEVPLIKIQSYLQESKYPVGMGIIDSSLEEAISGSDSQPDVDEIAQSIKMQKIFKQLKIHQQPRIKKTKTRVKKLKANISINNSTQINEINSLRNSPINRARAMTETKQKRQIMQTSIVDCKSLLAQAIDPKKTVQTFKKTLKATKLGPSTSFDQTVSTFKVQLTRPPKPLNLIQFSLKKLPIFPCDKLCQFQNNNHSLISSISLTKKIVDEQKLTKNKIITFYRTKKEKEAVSPTSESTNKDQYQFLCVMSESKKKEQILKIKQRRERQQDTRLVTRMRFNEIKQSTVLQRYLREKKAQNAQVLSKVWMNNFNRYSKSLEDPKD